VGIQMMSWLVAIPLLGVATGMRSLTPMAILCWYAVLGYLPVEGTWAGWTARLSIAIAITVLALGELIADKFPWIPDRISVGPLVWRFALGGLIGAIAGSAINGSSLEAALLTLVGVAIGAFGGYMVRRDLSEKFSCRDWQIAVVEDLAAILFVVFALHVLTL
jgi:uncharacterized membrane protein